MECEERTCTDGLIRCDGPEGCNGHGYLTAGGRKYRVGSTAIADGKALAPVVHERCAGHGLIAHGCVDLGIVAGTMTPRPDVVVDVDALLAPPDMGAWEVAAAG